tara:strand:+ start:355 stop:498 length:144 start_codon:yes stop_codon:yes gene_type:complete
MVALLASSFAYVNFLQTSALEKDATIESYIKNEKTLNLKISDQVDHI